MATRIDRIKGTREKIGTATYATLIPFGTDGKLVDMLSGLDLEEELIIGGDHYSTITELSDSEVSIEEIFAKKSDVNAGTAKNFYKTSILITELEDGTVTIDIKLWFVENTSAIAELVQNKIITIDETGTSTEIQEVLN